MTEPIVFDRAVRDIAVRSGGQANCGGIAKLIADVEPADRFQFVDAHDGRWIGSYSDDELIDECVSAIRHGVVAELTALGGGAPPPVRFVLRRVLVHEVDSNRRHNEAAGRLAIRAAIRRLTPPA